MSLYRLMARDRLKDGDVQPCPQPEVGGGRNGLGFHSVPPQGVRYESLDLIDLGHHLLLLAAEEKARAIIAEAESEAQRLYERARQTGYQLGREEGKRELAPSLAALAHAGQMLIVFEEQMVARYTPQIVRFALEIAEKIIGRAIEHDPQIVAAVLERAKREVAEAKQMRIWLHPTDYRLLAETRPDLVAMGGEAARSIEVVASEDVPRGGCRLETEMGIVDATLAAQIDEIRRQLLDEDFWQSAEATAQDNGKV